MTDNHLFMFLYIEKQYVESRQPRIVQNPLRYDDFLIRLLPDIYIV